MANGYLGETLITDLTGTPFENFTPSDWAMEYIGRYGGFDGAHHKDWVLDQVARILKGAPVEVKLAKWESGEENWRINVLDPTQEYHDWVKELRGEYDEEWGEYEYDYSEGIAP